VSEENLSYGKHWITEEDIAAVNAVLRSERLTQGPVAEKLESELCRRTGAGHCVVVSSGTAALHLACLAVSLERFGEEAAWRAVTSPITFTATANAPLHAGADSVAFSDVNTESGLIDPDAAGEVVDVQSNGGREPGILLPVSLNGLPPNLAELEKTARRFNWAMIEDAAHSLGGTYEAGRMSCASASCVHGEAAILSFHPVKHITCGEGGAVLTHDGALARRVRRLREHGLVRAAQTPAGTAWKYTQEDLGLNYRLSDLHAALGLSQLGRLETIAERRRGLAAAYRELLDKPLFQEQVALPPDEPGHSWHLFAIRFREAPARDAAYAFLREAGIGAQVHYQPVYHLPWHAANGEHKHLPGAEDYASRCLSLPLHPQMSGADVSRVVSALQRFLMSRASELCTHF